MQLKPVNYVEADYDIAIIELTSSDAHIGKSTIIIKKSGVWPVVVRYCGEEIARLEDQGASVKLLAVVSGWLVID